MLQIDYVEYKNLFATGNAPVRIDFNKAKNTLIVGRNGAGKSTVSSALIFALYGKDFRGVKKGGMVNSINKKKLVVECGFRKNGNTYKIIRGIKPDVLEIYENGALLHAESTKPEQQAKFEKDILRFPYNSFKQIVVTGSGQYVQFMKLLTPARRDFIENLLQLNVFSLMQKRLKDRADTAKDTEKDLKNSVYLSFEKIKIMQAEIDSRNAKSQTMIDGINSEIKRSELQIAKKESAIEKLNDVISQLQDKLKLVGEESASQFENENYSIQSELSKINTFVDKINHLENCPTCRQKVSADYKQSIKDSYTEEVKSLEGKISDLTSKIERIKKIETIRNTITEKISQTQMEIQYKQADISSENTNIKNCQRQIQSIQDDMSKTSPDMTNVKKTLKKDKESLDKVTEQIALFNYAALILKDTGIKATIIKEYIGLINKIVNNYLERFEFFVNFNLDENFSETIKSRFRDEFTYENFSEGEKARIDLALLCTFRDIARAQSNLDCNLFILDEMFSSELDSDGVNQLRSCITDMDNVNIVAISHDQSLIEKDWERVIEFKKEGNFSVMTEIM